MYSFNEITLLGNAGRDAELRYTQSGKAVTGFSMAVSRRFQRNNEWEEHTEWFNISVWGDRWAESVANNVKRGTKVMVVGELSTREYQTQSGEMRTSLDVSARKIIYPTPKSDQQGGNGGHDQGTAPSSSPSVYNPNQQTAATDPNVAPQQQASSHDGENLEDLPW